MKKMSRRYRDSTLLPDYSRPKRLIIVLAVLLAAVVPLIALIEPDGSRVMVISIAILLAGVLSYCWALYDSMEVADPIPPFMGISLILFSTVMLCIYLIRSRGVGYGSRAIGKVLLLLGVLFLVSASVFEVIGLSLL